MKYQYLLVTIAISIYAHMILSMDISQLKSRQNAALVDLIKSKIDAGSFDENKAHAQSLIKQSLPTSHATLLNYAIEKNSTGFIEAFCIYYCLLPDVVTRLSTVLDSPELVWKDTTTYTFLRTMAYDIEDISVRTMVSCLKLFKQHNISLNCSNAQGEPILCKYVQSGYFTLTSELLKAGCNSMVKERNTGKTPLHFAQHGIMAELLIKTGDADVNAQDIEKNTPLHAAAQLKEFGQSSIQKLVANGALINAKNHCGNTPLHIAIARKNKQTIVSLLELGADFAIKNDLNQPAIPIGEPEDISVKTIRNIQDIK